MASGTVESGIKLQMRNVFNLFNLHVTSLCWMMVGKYDLQINSQLFTHDDFYSCLVHCGSFSSEQKPTLLNENTNCCVIVLCSLSKSLASTFPLFWEAFYVFVCKSFLKQRCILPLRLWTWHTFSLENIRAVWVKATSTLPCWCVQSCKKMNNGFVTKSAINYIWFCLLPRESLKSHLNGK